MYARAVYVLIICLDSAYVANIWMGVTFCSIDVNRQSRKVLFKYSSDIFLDV